MKPEYKYLKNVNKTNNGVVNLLKCCVDILFEQKKKKRKKIQSKKITAMEKQRKLFKCFFVNKHTSFLGP